MTITRRTALALAGSMGAASLIGCDDKGEAGFDARAEASVDAGSNEAGTPNCTLYPEQVEGPYFVDGGLLRQDITDGKPGTPLTLVLQVVRAGACTPMPNVAVDVWHCDALGVYSGFPGQLGGLDTRGQAFLRGSQMTDTSGQVTFTTIYPGWYPGRTTHIHFKVRPTSRTAATSQLYFPEPLNDAVYAQNSPYNSRGAKDTTNTRDGANRQTGVPPMPVIEAVAEGFVARFVVAVAG